MISNKLLSKLKYEKEIELNVQAKKFYREERKKVFVVDDCVKVTKIFQATLGNESHIDLLTFNDEYEALECFLKEQPDLVILDIHLSSLDGIILRKFMDSLSFFTIPYIFMSFDKEYKEVLNAESYGSDIFLEKPFKQESLIVQIHNVLYNKKQDTKWVA